MKLVLTPPTLPGRLMRVEPLTREHAPALAAAAAEDRSSYGYTWVPEGLADAERYVRGRGSTRRAAAGWRRWCADSPTTGL